MASALAPLFILLSVSLQYTPPMFQMPKTGFTIVELSIVLLIIGLLVAAVLVGRELIKAANIRSTISQIEKYRAGMHAFDGKYKYIPGDMLESDAVRYGLTAGPCGLGVPGCGGDGDRVLESVEALGYWYHLSQSGMIEGGYTGSVLPPFTPTLKIRQSSHLRAIAAVPGLMNGYWILDDLTSANTLTPYEAYIIDDKVDDSFPLTGKFLINNTLSALPLSGNGSNTSAIGVFGDQVCARADNLGYNLTVEDLLCMNFLVF